MRFRALLLTVLVLATAAAQPAAPTSPPNPPSPAAPTSPAIPTPVVSAWIRALPGVPAGGYLTIENRSDHPLVLTGASSALFGEVALHRTVATHGITGMRPAERVVIAARSTLDFAAQGYHLMLIHPAHELAAGERVPIVLHFEGNLELTVLAEVRTRA
jgi:copper(I)-binding protein